MDVVFPSCGVTLMDAIGSEIIISNDFSTLLFSLSSTFSVTIYEPLDCKLTLKLPGAPFQPFLYITSLLLLIKDRSWLCITLHHRGVDALPSILNPLLASAEVNFVPISSLSFLLFAETKRFAACGPTLILTDASPSKTHSFSLFALLTVRCTT